MDLQPNSPTLYKRAAITKKSNSGSFIKGNDKEIKTCESNFDTFKLSKYNSSECISMI